MQTISIPSSHPVSPHNTANNSAAEKAYAAEKFGLAMHRALAGVDAKSHQQSNLHSPAAEETDSKSKSDSDDIDTDKKHPKAKRNSAPISHFLGMAGPAIATPQPLPTQKTSNAGASERANGGVTPIIADGAKPETIEPASTDDAKTADQSTEAAAAADAPAAETSTPAENSQHAPAIGSPAAQALAAQSVESNSDSANPAEAALATGADSPNSPLIDSKPAITQVGASLPGTRGTSAAKQDMTMKKTEKTTKVAGSVEQDLPGMSTAGSEELPKGQKLSIKEDGHGSEKLENAAFELPVRVFSSSESPAPTVTAAASTTAPVLDSRVLERTHDIVALHAMRLGEYTSDSLHVVVKPGGGIQLSLELRQSARGIEVHASLQKGDFDQLNQHWSDLQQRLEARGIRVAALAIAENFSSTSNQQFQQSKQQSPNQDPLYAGAFAEFALAGSLTEAPAARAARATAHRGWETWA
jgi:hypothetical protein